MTHTSRRNFLGATATTAAALALPPTAKGADAFADVVPDMTFDGAVAALRAHLAKRGFGDIVVNPSGGYDPTSTAEDAAVIRAQFPVYRRAGLDPLLWPRNAGSYPGYVFTGEPLRKPSAHFGLGHGGGAHAPDEYFVVESAKPKVAGWDGAVRSYVDYLQELAVI